MPRVQKLSACVFLFQNSHSKPKQSCSFEVK
jgi:hypothetical protein